MTLTHVFKAQAIFAWIWVVLLWVAPDMVIEPSGWALTPNMESLMQIFSVPMLGIGVLAWMAPTWTGDNVKQVGMVYGVGLNVLFIAVGLFHVSSEAAKFDPMAIIPTAIFAALFFWKCRASD
jgi:hypothetical protein